MRTRIISMLTGLVLSGLVPLALFAQEPPAAGCGSYDSHLTPEQAQYLAEQDLGIVEPAGVVPTIQRCDVDGNNVIDKNDIALIREHVGQFPVHPDDPMDWDGDGVIHGRDVGGCSSSCTFNRCSVKNDDSGGGAQEKVGNDSEAAATAENAATEPAACFQLGDFDGDGEEDFVGLYESTSPADNRGEWTLETIILNKNANGDIQHIRFAFTGMVQDDTQQITTHLSKQHCDSGQCMVDLNPGTLEIHSPAIVSYRNGEPRAIYYFVDREVQRAYYGIDD